MSFSVLQAAQLGGSVSLIGSSFIILTFLLFPKVRTTPGYMVLTLSLFDMVGSLAGIVGPAVMPQNGGSEAACQIQFFFIQLGLVGGTHWTFCMGLHMYLVVVKQKRHNYFKWYLAGTFAVLLLEYIAILAFQASGAAGVWCWVQTFPAQLLGAYLAIWVTLLCSIFFCINVFITTRSKLAHHMDTTGPDSKHRERQVAAKLLLFVSIFILGWFWASLHRITGAVNGVAPQWMPFMHVLMVTSNGFWNALVHGKGTHKQWLAFFRSRCKKAKDPASGKSAGPRSSEFASSGAVSNTGSRQPESKNAKRTRAKLQAEPDTERTNLPSTHTAKSTTRKSDSMVEIATVEDTKAKVLPTA